MANVKKTRAPRAPKIEITEENYMDFSAKALYKEIERLRKKADVAELKAENAALKKKVEKILSIANR